MLDHMRERTRTLISWPLVEDGKTMLRDKELGGRDLDLALHVYIRV
jgi:hypothetical protein